jgi:hypothetical protein
MNTDRRIYLTTAVVAVAAAAAITAFARWVPLHPTISASSAPEATQRAAYRQAVDTGERTHAVDVRM